MKRKISAVLAAAIFVLSTAGCNSDEKMPAQTDEAGNVLVSADTLETWKDIDRNKVIAYVEGADSEKFDITFGEFYSEYLYYLISYDINDDMEETYKERCETFREDVITYLTFERIFLEVAEEMGCGISSLTQEEKETIKTNAEATINSFISNYNTAAAEELGEEATQDEILNRSTELFTEALARAELTTEIIEKWEANTYIQNKLAAILNKDVEVSDAEVEAMFEEHVAKAKSTYESSKLEYESNSTYTWIYIPEGTRLADQILVAFDEETQTAISDARMSGDTDEAERLRNEAYNDEIKEKVNNIISLIESGSDFDELQATYNDDVADDVYTVIEGSERFVTEFTEAVFSVENIGDVAEPVITDYGVHIIKYAGDAYVSDADLVEIKDSMRNYLVEQEQTLIQQQAYEEWLARFPYTVDYELLQVTLEETEEGTAVTE